MSWLSGVDGCRAGWFRACREDLTGELRFGVVENVADLVRSAPYPTIVAVDIPIGLPERGSRACDVAARRCLGARRSSVFPAPVRAALAATSREEASEITCRIDGRRVAAQAWGISSKIRDVDAALTSGADLRAAIREVHPEVCFWAWNGGEPMSFAKKKKPGRAERIRLVEGWLGADIVERAREGYAKKELADDDVLDAIAALWTAHRIAAGTSVSLPERPPRDDENLPMQIVY